MRVVFSEDGAEAFDELAAALKAKAARKIDMLVSHPLMYPVRQSGIMRGYRYFSVDDLLFYYSVSSSEVRIAAIIPGRMRDA